MYGLGVIVNGLVIVGASFAALILKKFIFFYFTCKNRCEADRNLSDTAVLLNGNTNYGFVITSGFSL